MASGTCYGKLLGMENYWCRSEFPSSSMINVRYNQPSASARADSAPRRFRCGSLLPAATVYGTRLAAES
jgi:hypothetical protein